MTRTLSRLFLSVSLLSAATFTTSAFAQTPAELQTARKEYQEGEAKFKSGDYETALKKFRAAEAVKATPQAARYIGLSADKLERFPEAVGAYERFLADVPEKLKGEVDEIKKRVGIIKAMPGKLRVLAHPADAMVAIDGASSGQPAPRDFTLPPGKHLVKVSASGWKSAEKELDVKFASKQEEMIRLEKGEAVAEVKPDPKPEPKPAASDVVAEKVEEKKEPRSMVPVYVTAGVTGAALITGTIFGIMALSDSSKFKDTPTAELADSGENKALVADLCFGLALTFGITTAVLFLSKEDDSSDKPKTAKFIPMPYITPHGGGAAASLRF